MAKVKHLSILIQTHPNQFSSLEYLALFTKIRQELSRAEAELESEMLDLVQNTNLISLVLTALSGDHKYLKLESAWILTNIAYSNREILNFLLTLEFYTVIQAALNSAQIDI